MNVFEQVLHQIGMYFFEVGEKRLEVGCLIVVEAQRVSVVAGNNFKL